MTKLKEIEGKLSISRYGTAMIFPFRFSINETSGLVKIEGLNEHEGSVIEEEITNFIDSANDPISPTEVNRLLSVYSNDGATVGSGDGLTDSQLRAAPLEVSLMEVPLDVRNATNSIIGLITGLNQSSDIDVLGASTVIINVIGTFTATLTFEVSQNASTWYQPLALPHNGMNQSPVSSTTTQGAWLVDVAGWRYFRVRASAYISGGANTLLCTSNTSVINRSIFSGQSALPINNPGVNISNTMTGLNSFVALQTNGNSGTVIDIRGAFVGTITFQATIDGTNWINVTAIPYGTGSNVAGVQTTTTAGAWSINCMGAVSVRATFTAFTSGTPTVVIRIVQDSSVVANLNTGATTLPVSGTVTANQGTMVALPAGSNLAGDFGVQYRNVATGAASVTPINSPATPIGQSIKGTSGRALMFYGVNSSAGTVFLKVFNVASVTMGVTSASYEVPLPPGNNAVPISLEGGFEATTALVIAITGARGLTDNSVITANSVTGFVAFK